MRSAPSGGDMAIWVSAPVRTALAGAAALAVAMGIGRFAFTPILPMMQDDAGLTIAEGAWIASGNYVGYLIGALSMTLWPLRAARAIRIGLGTIALTTLVMGWASGFGAWVALRTVTGVASAWVLIHVSAWCLGKLAAAGRPVLNGVVFAGVGTGIALAGLVSLVTMRTGAGSARTWVIFGVLSLVASMAMWPVFHEAAAETLPTSEHQARRCATWNGEWIRLTLCYAAWGFAYIIPATFLPVMAKEKISDPAVFGWSWPLFGAAAAISAMSAAAVTRFTNRQRWITGQTVMAVGIALPVVWPNIQTIMLAALFVGGTFMVITMVGMQEAREVGEPDATQLMAAMTSSFALGQVAGPLIVGYVIRARGGFAPALAIAAALLLLSAAALVRRQHDSTPDAWIARPTALERPVDGAKRAHGREG